MNSLLPLTLGDENTSLYAGFWRRTAAHLVDLLILAPVGFLTYYVQKSNYYVFLLFVVISIAFHFFWSIYLLKKFGGTPGKLICGAIVVRKDGHRANWREAILRNVVDFPYGVYVSFFSLWVIHSIGYDVFQSLSFMEFGRQTAENAPSFHKIIGFGFGIWFWGELIVLLFNKRKRAIHDFIAGTVVIKKRLLPLIEGHIGPSPNNSFEQT